MSIQRPGHSPTDAAGAGFLTRHVNLAAWLLVCGVFVLSLRLSPDSLADSLYLAAILLALWSPNGRWALQIAGLSTLLVIARVFLKPAALSIDPILFNRAVLILLFWIAAFGVRNFRRSETARKRGEARTQEYLNIVNVAVLVLDAAGRIVLVNRYGLELLGLDRAPAVGTRWTDTFVPAEDRAAWQAAVAGAAAVGPEGTAHVSRLVRRGGPMRVVAWKSVALRNAAGDVSGTLSSGEEITRRLEIEDALSRSLRELGDLKYALDQSAIVATTDVQGEITYVNDTFCEISQYAREELLGRNHRVVNSGLHPPEFFHDLYHTIANGRVWRGELRNRAKDGSFYWVDTTIVPFIDEHGHPYQYIAIRSDITARKRSEATVRDQAALAQLGKMAAVVAHEVRNPLAGIRGALQVIGQRLDPASRERQVTTEIVARVDALDDIVQDLLQFARPRQPVLQRVAVSSLAQDTVSLLRADPALERVSVVVATNDVVVHADPELLKMVLLNLLMNGAQAMGGRGELEISAVAGDEWHELRVSDRGPGISPEVREHLFEPFYTTKHRGTGLGLATARRILELHGGTIGLECPPGGGTVAVIRLPTAVPHATAARHETRTGMNGAS